MNKQEYIDLYMSFMDTVKRDGKDKFINWLINDTTFFDDPASSRYHNNFKHGLINHSLNVLNYARNLYVFSKKNYPDFPDISAESIIITTLHHDICKANFYIKQKSWVKHEYTWIDYEEYKAGSEDSLNIGHGEKSVIQMLRNGFLDLTDQEMLVIRYHMGKINGDIDSEKAFRDPLVYLVHLADMSACMVEKLLIIKN